jgi:hypothetical protein
MTGTSAASAARLDIYKAQVENVRSLDSAWKQLNRTINDALRTGSDASLETHAKSLVLLFCAWSEATFSKLIHTPHGFTDDEIGQILREYKKSLEDGWKKCIELGLKKVASDPKRSNDIPNISQELTRIIQEYVISPRIVRNKIAHGQWRIALNRQNTSVNEDITESIQDLDAVEITKWYEVHRYLADVVEVLIESPDRVFHRDYGVIIGELGDYLTRTSDWNVDTKRQQLRRKLIPRQK